MGNIRTRKGKKKTTYQATVRVKGQPTLTQSFDDKAEAQHWERAMSNAARDSVHEMPDVRAYKALTVAAAIALYKKDNACSKVLGANFAVLQREIGSSELGRITHDFMKAYIKKMGETPNQYGKPYGPPTLCKHLWALRALVTHAAKTHRVDPPLAPISDDLLGKDWENERDRLMTPSEAAILRSEFKERVYAAHWALIFEMAFETAARQAEMVLAERSEFNLAEGVWVIPAHHAKSGKARQVPLSRKAAKAVETLVELLDAHNRGLAAKDPQAVLQTRVFWVFSSPGSVCSGWRKLTKKIGIVNLHFHDLRHAAITNIVLTKRKLSVFEIMKICGHESLAMLNRYSHLRGGDLVDRME